MQRDFNWAAKFAGYFDPQKIFVEKIKTLSRGFLTAVLAIVLCAFLAGCAAKGKAPVFKRPPAQRPPTQEPVYQPPPPPPRSNARPSTEDVMTPQRQASMRLVEKGKAFMDSGDYERAVASFRDAVSVDGSNGVAYFYMAVSSAKNGQAEIAIGLLDKAEAMLGANDEWMGKIDDLRNELGAPTHGKPALPSPIDEAF